MMIHLLIHRSVLWIFLLLAFATNAFAEQRPIVMGYYDSRSSTRPASGNRPPFSIEMIDTSILTDIAFAFAGIGYISKSVDPQHPRLTGDFTIQPLQGNDQGVLYPQINTLKEKSKGGLKTFLSIGGWGFNDPADPEEVGQFTFRLFSQMASKASNRKQFIDSAVAYLHKYGFDGLDIDWEYPGQASRGGVDEDFDNFLLLLQECSTAFRQASPALLLTIATAPFVPYGVPKKFHDDPDSYFRWIAQCAQYVDRVNVMCYDYHGPFDMPKITGANSPLHRDTDPKSTFYIAKTIQLYLDNGIPKEKIVLGMPAFGHSFAGVEGLEGSQNGPGKPFSSAGPAAPSTHQKGFLAYFEAADMISKQMLTFGADTVTSTAYGYNPKSKEWISFDTPETIRLKAMKAKSFGLAGVMFWAIDLDEYYWKPTFPNIRGAWDVLHAPTLSTEDPRP